MAFDPRVIPETAEESLADRVARLERRLAVVERARSPVYIGQGPPSGSPRTGALYWDDVNHKFYVRGTVHWRIIDAPDAGF